MLDLLFGSSHLEKCDHRVAVLLAAQAIWVCATEPAK